ncbi:hypothetical protein [Kribbella soli]|uniref:Uncharacterized protein n=1 Tax=Kribbella soli TaxID=1124743 RepID=A0A4R0H5I6_9ACTN|nr:hypothetical protein [Kribbella soli]TCC03712.1 hypothetical protein E0H45_31800 [Kribbella soli]
MRSLLWVVVLSLLGVAGTASPSLAVSNNLAGEMSVTGAGGGTLGPEWRPFEGDPVRFEIDGRATDPLHPSGSFHVVHRKPDGRLLAEFSGRLTSLKAVDEVAVATGVIEVADHPGLELAMVGKPVSFTVYDGGSQDRIGWMWGFFGAPVDPLQGTAPGFVLTDGGFRVDDAADSPGPGRDGTTVSLQAAADGGTTVAAATGGPGEPMRFELAAHVPRGSDPTQVRGRFRFVEAGTTEVEGKLTCLATGGPVAMTTGIVTGSTDPARIGKPVSFALKDGAIDRVGWLWGWSDPPAPIADCRSTVPFHASRWGGVVVRS